MKRFYFLFLVVVACLFTAATPAKKSVLIIGDSISIGYTEFVAAELADVANVVHNPGNAQDTTKGLANIDEWLAAGKWDVIHFNWGLWDLCYRNVDSKTQGNRDRESGTIAVPLDEYAKKLELLLEKLEATGAKLIFATTTYVPINEAGRFVLDVQRYNRVAEEIMERHNVTINPLYSLSLKVHPKYGNGDDDVHYSKEGYSILAKPVIKEIKKKL